MRANRLHAGFLAWAYHLTLWTLCLLTYLFAALDSYRGAFQNRTAKEQTSPTVSTTSISAASSRRAGSS